MTAKPGPQGGREGSTRVPRPRGESGVQTPGAKELAGSPLGWGRGSAGAQVGLRVGRTWGSRARPGPQQRELTRPEQGPRQRERSSGCRRVATQGRRQALAGGLVLQAGPGAGGRARVGPGTGGGHWAPGTGSETALRVRAPSPPLHGRGPGRGRASWTQPSECACARPRGTVPGTGPASFLGG